MMLYITFTTYLPTDDFQGESNLSFVWFKNMGMHVPSLTTIWVLVCTELRSRVDFYISAFE